MKAEAQVRKIAEAVVDTIVGGSLDEAKRKIAQLQETVGLTDEIRGLKRQVAELEIQRDKKQEEFDRREREIEHKVGLERQRQSFEVEQAKREATVEIREQNLAAEREQFEKNMKFMQDRFAEEVTAQRVLLERIIERIPTAEIFANLGVRESEPKD